MSLLLKDPMRNTSKPNQASTSHHSQRTWAPSKSRLLVEGVAQTLKAGQL